MRCNKPSIGLRSALVIFAMTLFVTGIAAGQAKEKVLYSFDERDGYSPYGSLIFDAFGNLYGTTVAGGPRGEGIAFELTPTVGGAWTEKALHAFGVNVGDGANPYASLIFDTSGNLYGTTHGGGIDVYGTVFELMPVAGGAWTEKLPHKFNENFGTDGGVPYAGLTLDGFGNLYGTTYGGGAYNSGTVFELMPLGDGHWTERILHAFNDNGEDGVEPRGGLVLDASGNLYGTTSDIGFGAHYGTVFELTPATGGGWTETVLHSFLANGVDGTYPVASLVFDAFGNLYGTTYQGGAYDFGTVFELRPGSEGSWTETVLHSFNYNGTDGAYPSASVIFDSLGNLYGTTYGGGASTCLVVGSAGCGTVFEMMPAVGGGWTETVLHSFDNSGTDGTLPSAGLVLDAAGNLYGATQEGGAKGYGTVFEIKP